MTKWMTSGAQRLKANLKRSFGARKDRKAAQTKDKSFESVVASVKIGDLRRRSNGESLLSFGPHNVAIELAFIELILILFFGFERMDAARDGGDSTLS